MMNAISLQLLSWSAFLPLAVALLRLNKIAQRHYPFVGFVLLQAILMIDVLPQAWASFLALLQLPLLLFQLRHWGIFRNSFDLYCLLQLCLPLLWLTEEGLNGFRGSVHRFGTFAGLVVVLCAVHLTSRVVEQINIPLFRNPLFLAPLGLLVLFTFRLLLNMLALFGFEEMESFRRIARMIMAFVSLVSSLLFTLAFIWMPLQRRYRMPSSLLQL
jgi:hypothetical protein